MSKHKFDLSILPIRNKLKNDNIDVQQINLYDLQIKKDINVINSQIVIDSLKTGASELRISYNYMIDNIQYSYPNEFLHYVDYINDFTIQIMICT